jgi:hypothetical protein
MTTEPVSDSGNVQDALQGASGSGSPSDTTQVVRSTLKALPELPIATSEPVWSDSTKIRMLRSAVFATVRMLSERGVTRHPLLVEVQNVIKQTEITTP